jgi:hypothetical protein
LIINEIFALFAFLDFNPKNLGGLVWGRMGLLAATPRRGPTMWMSNNLLFRLFEILGGLALGKRDVA